MVLFIWLKFKIRYMMFWEFDFFILAFIHSFIDLLCLHFKNLFPDSAYEANEFHRHPFEYTELAEG